MENWRDLIKQLARTGYIPNVDNHIADTNMTDSKFGGRPYVSKKHPWPICSCGKEMKFFLQLNSDQLPSKLNKNDVFGDGLLQLFYCIICDCYKPFDETHKVRVLNRNDLNEFDNDFVMKDSDMFPFRCIVGWEETIEYPNFEEFMQIKNLDIEIDDFNEEYSRKQGEKLLGWPAWVQGIEYPNCPDCGKKMEYIFQIDSEINIPYMFGDCGAGHITQCKEHRDKLTFTWACC